MPRKKRHEDPTSFGARLARCRQAAGYTQVELAQELSVSQRMIAYYESPQAIRPRRSCPLSRRLSASPPMRSSASRPPRSAPGPPPPATASSSSSSSAPREAPGPPAHRCLRRTRETQATRQRRRAPRRDARGSVRATLGLSPWRVLAPNGESRRSNAARRGVSPRFRRSRGSRRRKKRVGDFEAFEGPRCMSAVGEAPPRRLLRTRSGLDCIESRPISEEEHVRLRLPSAQDGGHRFCTRRGHGVEFRYQRHLFRRKLRLVQFAEAVDRTDDDVQLIRAPGGNQSCDGSYRAGSMRRPDQHQRERRIEATPSCLALIDRQLESKQEFVLPGHREHACHCPHH